MKKLFALFLSLMLLTGAAMADASFSGTVVSTGSISILVPADGTLAAVHVQTGDRVAAGDPVAELLTTTIYAEQDGTVRLFGSEGASLASINEQYGAVLYILPDVVYTLSASTKNAYNTEENKRIIPGETVYLCASASTARTGAGIVTGVNGTDYLVSVTSGDFNANETVNIFRDSSYTAKSRIGQGKIAYTGAIGYTGTGEEVSIASTTTASAGRGMNAAATTTETTTDDATTPKSLVKLLVADGQHVTASTPLFTVSTAEAYHQTMLVSEQGIVAATNADAGSTVAKGSSVAVIYPDSAMRLALSVSELDLDKITLGSAVTITFLSGETAQGVVESINGHAEISEETAADDEAEEEETYFTIYVAFTPTNTIAYGMTATAVIAE